MSKAKQVAQLHFAKVALREREAQSAKRVQTAVRSMPVRVTQIYVHKQPKF